MFLARVVRPLVATQKDASLHGRKLLLVELTDPNGEPNGATLVAVDLENTQAGEGDWVLIQREGSGCRQMLDDPQAPVNAVVCGIVDDLHAYQKSV